MIKRLTVKKLYGHTDFDLCFQPDMNVLTGRNGCGKTTLLKLAWYMISGNLDRVLSEMTFDAATVETDIYKLSVSINKASGLEGTATWELSDSRGIIKQVPSHHVSLSDFPREREIHEMLDLKKYLVEAQGASLFFPTFRRIEGGFSMSRLERQFNNETAYNATVTKVDDAMSELSELLSAERHRFITAISTQDIVEILTNYRSYAFEHLNSANFALSQNITSITGKYYAAEISDNSTKVALLESTLNHIQKIVLENRAHQERRLQPFMALGQLIVEVFHHKGIRIGPDLILGDAEGSISSDVLSAGEKQMLSFVAYNTFSMNHVIFIDEPEISLHVDWQRILFSILEAQGTNNQFIVATHSPFIYSKYTDKEIVLNSDRGE